MFCILVDLSLNIFATTTIFFNQASDRFKIVCVNGVPGEMPQYSIHKWEVVPGDEFGRLRVTTVRSGFQDRTDAEEWLQDRNPDISERHFYTLTEGTGITLDKATRSNGRVRPVGYYDVLGQSTTLRRCLEFIGLPSEYRERIAE